MKRLFVAMPYGTRKGSLDYEYPNTDLEIDFDAVWKEIFEFAIPEGFEARRADQLRESGLIEQMYNEWLFSADVVLADLTFGNPNVYYEVGVRQALSPKGTVLVACKGSKLPFDVRNQKVIPYDYFAATSVRAFQTELRLALESATHQGISSPVHRFISGLFVRRYQNEKNPDESLQHLTQRISDLEAALVEQRTKNEEERLREKIKEASTPQRLLSLHNLVITKNVKSIRILEQLAIRLRDAGYFDQALQTLQRALEIDGDDPELLREIGFIYRKNGPAHFSEAENYFQRSLQLNDQDPELRGMLGGLLKRRKEYKQALSQYEQAHKLQPNDLYPLVNLGAMCAALKRLQDAREWYLKVKATCERLINENLSDHWTYLCLGEAAVALDDRDAAETAYRMSLSSHPPVEHIRSAVEQLDFLCDKGFAVDIIQTLQPILQEYLLKHERS